MAAPPFRVLIVDDSRIFRGSIEDALAGVEGIEIIGSVWSGEKALEVANKTFPDFVTLDVEMPGLGGLETLRALGELGRIRQQAIGIVLVSSHTKRGAAVTIEGLHSGAFDFVTKPSGPDERANFIQLREQLTEKLVAFRGRIRDTKGNHSPKVTLTNRPDRPIRRTRFRAMVIGSSTGGPEALSRLLPGITANCPVPIFLVQHLPAEFSEYFATSLERRCGGKIVVATEGMIAEPATIYVAQGGSHLTVMRESLGVALRMNNSPPENGCRPAADVLFRSAAAVYGGDVLAVVLTGMGTDGAKGASMLKRAGAHVIVQDEASSVVWGMPGAVVAAGAANEILSLNDLNSAVRSHLGISIQAMEG